MLRVVGLLAESEEKNLKFLAWHQQVRDLLLRRGYEVVDLNGSRDPKADWPTSKINAIVHLPSHFSAVESLSRLIREQDLTISVLHVLDLNLDRNFLVQFEAICYEQNQDCVVWKGSEFEIIKRVEMLLRVKEVENQLESYRTSTDLEKSLVERLRDVDLKKVLREAIVFMSEETGAQDVLWLEPKGLEMAIKGQNAVYFKIDSDYWQSLRVHDVEWVRDRVAQWCPVEVLKRAEKEVLELRTEQGLDVILPLASGRDQMLGYFVLSHPEKWMKFRSSPFFLRAMNTIAFQVEQAMHVRNLKEQTFRDDLTNLYNQRYLPLILDQELSRASRGNHQFSVLFLDVDYFKTVNDSNGHMVGSQVLVELSKLFHAGIRSTDFAFRYGGDEYIIILSGANSQNASMVAERLRKRVQDAVFLIQGAQVKVTVSIGIATYPEHAKTTQDLLNMADSAMYEGKHRSRNVVYLAS